MLQIAPLPGRALFNYLHFIDKVVPTAVTGRFPRIPQESLRPSRNSSPRAVRPPAYRPPHRKDSTTRYLNVSIIHSDDLAIQGASAFAIASSVTADPCNGRTSPSPFCIMLRWAISFTSATGMSQGRASIYPALSGNGFFTPLNWSLERTICSSLVRSSVKPHVDSLSVVDEG